MGHVNTAKAAKNTMIMYVRMILVILVSLYTTRLILQTLGDEDFGIFNVVAAIVNVLVFINASLSGACQRFFAFEIGHTELKNLRGIFSSSIIIFLGLEFLIFIFLETIGLWYVNNKLEIPEHRMYAANWAYQFSILTFLISFFAIPYNALLIAHEKMKVYAYIGLLEAALKLLLVFVLVATSYDKLITYGILIFFSSFLITLVTIIYCRQNYTESRGIQWKLDMQIIKPLGSYASWNVFGAIANVLKTQGTNILINPFFGPLVNTARGISTQVGSAFQSFIANLYLSVRPQITKAYAAGDKTGFEYLTLVSAKGSCFLLLIISIPVLLETEFLLSLWLGQLPEYSALFTRLFVISIFLEAVTNQLYAAVQATGNIKKYQLFYNTLLLFIVPISYFFLKLGYPPQVTFYVSIAITVIAYVPQMWITSAITGISSYIYFRKVILVVFLTTLVSYIFPLGLCYLMDDGIVRLLTIGILGSVWSLTCIFFVGLESGERKIIITFVKNKFRSWTK